MDDLRREALLMSYCQLLVCFRGGFAIATATTILAELVRPKGYQAPQFPKDGERADDASGAPGVQHAAVFQPRAG